MVEDEIFQVDKCIFNSLAVHFDHFRVVLDVVHEVGQMVEHQLQVQTSIIRKLLISQAKVDMSVSNYRFEDEIEFLENFYFLFVTAKTLEHFGPEGEVRSQEDKCYMCYFIILAALFVLYQEIGQMKDVFEVGLFRFEF